MIRKIFFVVFLFMALCSTHAYSQEGPPTAAPPLPKDGKHKGLQVDRALVLKNLKTKDSTLVFKPEKVDNRLPALIAHATVEVVGSEFNLREIKYKVFFIPGDRPSFTVEFEKIVNLVGTVIPREELSQWLLEKYKHIVLYPDKEIKEAFDDRGTVLDLVYSPSLKCITFAIRSE